MTDTPFQPVILSGGSGTRLWPLSRRTYPKQLLALVGEGSLLQQAVQRLAGTEGRAAPIIIANDDHRFLVRQQLAEIGVTPEALILEPVGRNTAPAVALACHAAMAGGRDPVIGIFASDHRIEDESAFTESLRKAIAAAAEGWIVTFSIAPTRPETGYGYIRHGAPVLGLAGVDIVDAFVEKPDAATAQSYLDLGGYGWNSGMFVFRASVMLRELCALAPEVEAAAAQAYAAAQQDIGFTRLDAALFGAAPSLSIDVAVMEKTRHAATVTADMGWSDLGSWGALYETAGHDAHANATIGRVATRDTSGSYLRSEDGRLLTAIGIEDMVVVSTADAVLVAPKDRAGEVKEIVADLSQERVAEAEYHRRVARPWGTYEDIDKEDGFRVKRIIVNPGGRLSLQRHRRRSEHWVVVRGTAHVTIDGEEQVLTRNMSTYVSVGATHRLENKGPETLHMIEVQVGDYVEEDDIERLEDVYGR
ncbi:MAG: mannose-1-phosphate guanylyltransferase/mannose-6-phosphate isomerase [Alphaproteobacteria bacterium]